MSILSPEDYELAISSGNDRKIVKIPVTPLPPKQLKDPSRERVGRNGTGLSTGKILREGSADSAVPEEPEPRGSIASKARPRSANPKKAHTDDKPTPIKVGHPESDSSENGDYGGDKPLSNEERSQRSRDSSVRSWKSKRFKPIGSEDPAVNTSTTKRPKSGKSKGSRSRSRNTIHPADSEDEMEDWEIEPGVISGSDANSGDDSETEHSECFILAIHIPDTL
jgi:hypothetical protein